jgi:hypothetical protein
MKAKCELHIVKPTNMLTAHFEVAWQICYGDGGDTLCFASRRYGLWIWKSVNVAVSIK